MSDYDLMEEGCEGCGRLLAKVNELRIDLNSSGLKDQNVRDGREGAFHDALSFAGLDPIEGYTEEDALDRFGDLKTRHELALIDRDEFNRKYERAVHLQKGSQTQCGRAMVARNRFRSFIEDVAKAAPEDTPLREQAQAILEESGGGDSDRDAKLVALATITNCILATCSYCKASHDTGMTTEHTCIAKPMWNLWDKKASEITDE